MKTQMKTRKIKVTAQQAKDFIKSPECLMCYLVKMWRNQNRQIFFDKDGYAYCECPSKYQHRVYETFSPQSFKLARVVRERGTGKGYLHCDICGGTWDVFTLFALDHLLTRKEAIRAIGDAMCGNYEIVDGVKFETVDDIHDRENRFVVDDDLIHVTTLDEYRANLNAELDEEETQTQQ